MRVTPVQVVGQSPTEGQGTTTAAKIAPTEESGNTLILPGSEETGTGNAHSIEHANLGDHHAAQFPGFDPTVHKTDEAGNPIPRTYKGQVVAGEWKKIRKGSIVQGVANVANVDLAEQARQVCNIAISGAVMVFGEQWKPETKEEGQGLASAVQNYFQARGSVPLTPGTALAMVCLAYAAPRLVHAETKSKLSRAFGGVRDFFRGFFQKSKV